MPTGVAFREDRHGLTLGLTGRVAGDYVAPGRCPRDTRSFAAVKPKCLTLVRLGVRFGVPNAAVIDVRSQKTKASEESLSSEGTREEGT
jgi:hypothetical protein